MLALVAGGSFGTALLALAGIAVAASGWLFKLALITRIAYTQGFALQHVPARTRAFVDFLVQAFGGEDRDPWLLAAGCETQRRSAPPEVVDEAQASLGFAG